MGKTTNILDLNNRLEKVEKGNVSQNNYNSLKNRPKINGNLLTGDKTGAQLGLAEALEVGSLSALTTTDKSSTVAAINEVNNGLTNIETSLTSMDRLISFPFTMPSDVSSKEIGENITINLSANVPETAYIIGISVNIFTQKRTVVGEYFGQAGFKNNQLYLIDVLKKLPSGYNGISGYLIVGIPHT